MFRVLLFSAFLFATLRCYNTHEPRIPTDYLWLQRAFPFQDVPSEAYYDAVAWTRQAAARGGASLDWQTVGPNNVSGRITDVAMHASDQQTVYAASASGGVWKSTNAGQTWAPISDALPSLSIGDIAIDPSDKNTIYCGTGETNGGGGSVTYDGRGVFKSTDAGSSWQAAGLENTGSIGRIAVDPQRPNRVFVAAMGSLFSNNPERGVFRSNDGGTSWEQNLFVNDSVGAIDLAIHPQNPDTLFAVTWERIRRPNKRVYGGQGSAVWRSTDGGDSWTKLAGGLPSGPNVGRMGIDIAPSEPNVMYLTVANTNGGFAGVYKSSNHGDSWALVPQNSDPGYYSFGWWFGQIRVHPGNADHVFNLGAGWKESSNSGASWSEVSDYLHADYHAFYIHPANPSFQVVGNDGGVYISTNGGGSWQHRPFPITQFYTCEIDFQAPTRYSGGAQDNGTQASFDFGPDDWTSIFGGDGFVTLVNPLDNTIYYAESQYGGFGGSNGASAPTSSRYNWNTPYIFDPNDPSILYFGAEKLFKSTDAGLSWTALSGDLSNGSGGSGGVVYGTITAIAASGIDGNVLWAGTDDGNVWTTSNGGANWTKVSTALPKRWVTRLVADLSDAQTAYVCFSGFRHHENIAHIYKTTDLGQTWTDVSGNLPDVPVNDLIIDPLDTSTLYIATDAGIFTTSDGGDTWMSANAGLPLVPVLDLTFHAPTRKLLAATYGRSMYTTQLPLPSATTDPSPFNTLHISPNPVSDQCLIEFSLNGRQTVELAWYNAAGMLVKTMNYGLLPAGEQRLELELRSFSPGIYFCRVRAGGKTAVEKVVKLNI